MSRYADFDAYWSEAEEEPFVIKAFGREYVLPSDLPASVALRILRLQRRYFDCAIPSDELMDLGLLLIGKEQIERLCADGMTVGQLGELLQWILSSYAGNAGDEKNERTLPGIQGPREGEIDILACWSAVEADFQREYGLNLVREMSLMSWRRFLSLLAGLSSKAGFWVSSVSKTGRQHAPREYDTSTESLLRSIGW